MEKGQCFTHNDKQLLRKHRSTLISPISGKNLERLLYNSMLKFFLQHTLISPNQSVFKTRIHVLMII